MPSSWNQASGPSKRYTGSTSPRTSAWRSRANGRARGIVSEPLEDGGHDGAGEVGGHLVDGDDLAVHEGDRGLGHVVLLLEEEVIVLPQDLVGGRLGQDHVRRDQDLVAPR